MKRTILINVHNTVGNNYGPRKHERDLTKSHTLKTSIKICSFVSHRVGVSS